MGDEFTTSRPGLYSSHGAAASERRGPQSRSTSTRATSTAPRRAARFGISMCPGGPAAWATGPSPGWPPRRHPAAPEPERPVAGSGGTDRPLPAGSPPSRWAAPMADTDCRTVAIPTPPAIRAVRYSATSTGAAGSQGTPTSSALAKRSGPWSRPPVIRLDNVRYMSVIGHLDQEQLCPCSTRQPHPTYVLQPQKWATLISKKRIPSDINCSTLPCWSPWQPSWPAQARTKP